MENKQSREVIRICQEVIETLERVIYDVDSTPEQLRIARESLMSLRTVQQDATLGAVDERTRVLKSMLRPIDKLLKVNTSLHLRERLGNLSTIVIEALAAEGGSRDLP